MCIIFVHQGFFLQFIPYSLCIVKFILFFQGYDVVEVSKTHKISRIRYDTLAFKGLGPY